MNRAVIIAIILAGYIVYVAFKHKETWRKLAPIQLVGVLLSFIGVTGTGAAILFYGVRYLISFTGNEIIRFVIQFFSAVVVIMVGVLLFTAIVRNITNGILPIERKRN